MKRNDAKSRSQVSNSGSFGRKTYEIGDITVLADGIKVQLK